MEDISPRKERRNPLAAFLLLGIFTAVLLLLPGTQVTLHKDNFEAGLDGGKVIGENINLLFVGDIMLSRAVGDIMEKTGNWKFPFLETADFLSGADLTFGNLEGPISSRGTNVGSVYSFRADPKVVEGLAYAGFDVLSLANNHIWDYGSDALIDTIQLLKSVGISPVGGRLNYERAYMPVIKEVVDTKIAYLAYTNLIPPTLGYGAPAVAFLDQEVVVSDVRAAKAQADIVVVSLHWGNEYETSANDYQITVGHALIDVGASLVVGHHPHIVQEIEKYNGGFIAYSLGNFVFDQNFSKETMEGIILQATVRKNKIAEVKPVKIKINSSFQPYLADY